MIKPHYENYRYTTEICTAESGSIVECRLAGGEIGNILAIRASLSPTECICQDGEIKYGGKLTLYILYEDGESHVCRAERGAEFTHRAEHPQVTPACFAIPSFTAQNITRRREGSNVYVSVVVGAVFKVFAETQAEYLLDGEGLTVKQEERTFIKTLTVKGGAEADDEFEIDYVGDILMHAENVRISSAETGAGIVSVEGEVALQFCALKEDGVLCSYERLVPFKTELLHEDCLSGTPVAVKARVTDAKLSVVTDEEKGKCKVEAQTDIALTAELYLKDTLKVATDAYSARHDIRLKKEEKKSFYCAETLRFTERVSGVAALGETIDYSTSLKAALLPKAELTVKNGEAEGAVEADVLLKDKDGGYKTTKMALPFVFPVNAEQSAYTEAEAIVCGLGLRQRKEGEAEAEATLKVTVRRYLEERADYIAAVEEGEEYPENDCAISVYLPCAGDGLWETAKRLRRDPEELQKSNPELEFPLKGGERIFVYRQKS